MHQNDIADRHEITELIHDYARLIDDGRPDAVAELFAEECMFRSTTGRNGTATGRTAVAARLELLLSTFEATSHHVSNIQIWLDSADRAHGVTYLFAWHSFGGDRPPGLLWGRYLDSYVRTDDGWRIGERSLHVTGEQDFPFGWLPPEPPRALKG